VAIDLFNDRLKTFSDFVEQDDMVSRPHSQDSGNVLGFFAGYCKGALASEDLVNKKTSHKEVPKMPKVRYAQRRRLRRVKCLKLKNR
jgi:hypothetical protein